MLNSFTSLFSGEHALPFVDESEMATVTEYNLTRQQAYHWHFLNRLLERQEVGGQQFSVMRRNLNECLCHLQYGYNKWWNFPEINIETPN